jgi:hypothetical protein
MMYTIRFAMRCMLSDVASSRPVRKPSVLEMAGDFEAFLAM